MISTSGNGTIATPRASRPPVAWAQGGTRAWWWALGIAALILVLIYAPNFHDLYRAWTTDENYTHGILVIPIALFILWGRLKGVSWERESADIGAAPWWGWGLLAVAMVVRIAAYEGGFQWAETITLLPAVVGLTWAFGGRPLLERAWPAIFFLIFMLPLPASVNSLIALPLQRIAATGSYFCLQFLGFWVIQEGNVLHLTTPMGTRLLDVAMACSGLKMLMTLAATVTATVIVLPLMDFPLPLWKRLVLLASALPIALISNIARIVTTGCCYYYLEGGNGVRWAHDICGWMMMPLALILVGLELRALSWLTPERTEAEEDDRKVVLPLLNVGKTKPPVPDRDHV
jgi:exosortase